MSQTQTENTIVLHGKTRWSDHLAAYVFRDGVEFTVTLPGKNPITHREDSKCLVRVNMSEPPQPVKLATTKAAFTKQVALEAKGEDRTAWFCTRCLIQLPKEALAPEQIAAREAKASAEQVAPAPVVEDSPEDVAAIAVAAPVKAGKPVGSKVTRPARTNRRQGAKRS